MKQLCQLAGGTIGQFEDSTKVLPGEEIESSSDEDDQNIVSEKNVIL